MIPVDQTTFGNGDDGSEPGNCLAACVASILHLPLGAVPNFAAYGEDGWLDALLEWLGRIGLGSVDMFWQDGVPEWVYGRWIGDEQVWIASGPAVRGLHHSVVMRGRSMAHDPHPSRAGLIQPQGLRLIVPTHPQHAVTRCACGRIVPPDRLCYVTPTCHVCLPPPPPLEVIHVRPA